MKEIQGRTIYLSIPYTWDAETSFKIANEISAELLSKGFVVISPISQSHPISDHLPTELKYDHEFWMKQDLPLIPFCDTFLVVSIGKDGAELIDKSKGCLREIKEANYHNLFISRYVYNQKRLDVLLKTKKEYPLPVKLNQAERHNDGKIKWSFVDFKSLENMVKVLEKGALKYPKDNWKKGMPLSEVFESLLRHIFEMLNGEMIDPESKLPHIGHIQCNAMFIDYILRNYPEKFNDLIKKEQDE